VAAVKAGTISINAAAAVASLPAEEQVAAATAGRDELKQAAKRVREARRKAPAATPVNEAPPEDDSLEALRHRVVVLSEENGALRRQVAALEALLQQASATAGSDTAPPF
jgi:hypothetical protein